MKAIKFLTTALLATTLLCSCNQEDDTPQANGSAVQFTAAINKAGKASGITWDNTDEIGVFMKTAGDNISTSEGLNASNVKYTTNGTNFTGAPIYYPQVGAVDFVAYYPYRATPNPDLYIYKVDVVVQTTPASIDLLYSDNATNKSKSTTAVPLEFSHKLSRVVLNIKAGTAMTNADLANISVKITGMPTKADFDLGTGTFATPTDKAELVPLVSTTTAGYVATYTAILVPQEASVWNGRKMVFRVLGADYEYIIPNGDDFATGKNYAYEIKVNAKGITVSRGQITDWTTTPPNDWGEVAQISIPQTVKVLKGTFLMGSSNESNITTGTAGVDPNATPREPKRYNDETQYKVTLTKDFYMGKYQVTFAQYDAFCNATGKGTPSDENWGRGDRPVINVSWNDAVAYCEWLSGVTGGIWRLPTEAEWEYACRGGKANHPFGIGTGYELNNTNANFDWKYSWFWDGTKLNTPNTGTSLRQTMPVGSYDPNAWGLYDMHGNVYEWCSDWYNSYNSSPITDPTGPTTGYERVLRGGSWFYKAQLCRSAFRGASNPADAYYNFGFRVVFVP